MQQTPFYDCHVKSNGRMVDFGGWALPVNYGSQIKEHEVVRNDAGMFDVSHMVINDISGIDAKKFLQKLLSNDVAKLEKHGNYKALYSGMLNTDAGIIDDLIVYLMPFGYRIVTNAATYQKDMAWIKKNAIDFEVVIKEREDFAMLAVQGPNAIAKVAKAIPEIALSLQELKPFSALEYNNYFFARTGYTGENGLEIMLPVAEVKVFWELMIDNNILPCGLGARDTLRLEAGMNLYGHDMDETITPHSCGMSWVVDLNDQNRNFIGKEKYIELIKQENKYIQIGLLLQGKGVLREGQKIFFDGIEGGIITSGTFSPSIKKSIAIARVKATSSGLSGVEIRGNIEPVKIVKLPFVRNGKKVCE